jgi:hypothetical protein
MRTEAAMRGRFSGLTGGSPEDAGLAGIGVMEDTLQKQIRGPLGNTIVGNPEAKAQLQALQGIKAELQAIRASKPININAHTE